MADEDTRLMLIHPAALAIAPNERGAVCLLLGHPDKSLGLAPGLELAVEFHPQEAIDLADKLLKVAALVLASRSQH